MPHSSCAVHCSVNVSNQWEVVLTSRRFAVLCCVAVQVRIIEAAKEKLQKDMRSNSSKNLAAMVSVQA